ncbi:alpha/beta hydrolase [Rothia nasimurium]|uniref:alpha/beta hydrolase n=1 Tax=Rothia nasimurium TaxID=85336 RepID=UPI001F266F95|nr:dienelactone hydrolase family protein [Rothia nasimurium]
MADYTVDFSRTKDGWAGTHLVLFLHGYGSNEKDLMGLRGHINLPEDKITYAAMRAPQPVGYVLPADADTAEVKQTAQGYQWWPLNQQLHTVSFKAIELATDYLLMWVSAIADEFESITLVGFSQGMAVATSAARRKPKLFKAVVGLSGYVVDGGDDYFMDAEFVLTPLPLFWGRGDADTVIPADKIAYTADWAHKFAQATIHTYPGLAHSVSAEELDHFADFIKQQVLS